MRSPEEIEELLNKLEGMYNAYSEADAKYQDDQDKKAWGDKYGERLGKYSDKLKTLNGDDFDIMESSRNEYKDSYSDLTDDDYVNALEENIKKVLARVWPEATEEQKEQVAAEAVAETEEGNTEPEANAGATSDEVMKTEPKNDFSLVKPRGDSASKDTNEWPGNPKTSGGRKGKTSDEEAKEAPAKDPVKEEYEELLRYKESMPKRGE